jgi:transcription elongation factor GreA
VKANQQMSYTIVSDTEANLREGKISVNTPIAQGLLGKKVGDVVEIKVPRGTMTFEILKITL